MSKAYKTTDTCRQRPHGASLASVAAGNTRPSSANVKVRTLQGSRPSRTRGSGQNVRRNTQMLCHLHAPVASREAFLLTAIVGVMVHVHSTIDCDRINASATPHKSEVTSTTQEASPESPTMREIVTPLEWESSRHNARMNGPPPQIQAGSSKLVCRDGV
ncbi:hypothetical protein BaRGS_00000652 [Batillaria attramentaria]|uniref:Uncharacterized protein n=1 Tax=Batillaria attramentaria TaxID=370345 RepID=A0ABD0MBK2_9CAEN